ncbi:hypothetical protein [Azovibrio restrictus]|uniref:hypothetical protein n=1 Tax=Azovibrio restrictus TaxID=146938 RepID=UPI0026EE0847|nr:hypothetical protein [Azovibrio restrictus]
MDHPPLSLHNKCRWIARFPDFCPGKTPDPDREQKAGRHVPPGTRLPLSLSKPNSLNKTIAGIFRIDFSNPRPTAVMEA